MKYRLVALDLDGTLLDSRLRIDEETVEVLQQVRALGVQTVIATGRHHVAAYPYWHQLGFDTPAICCNGAYLYDYRERRVLAGSPLTREEAGELLELVREHRIFSMIYDAHFMAYEGMHARLEYILGWSAQLHPDLRPRIERVDSFEALVQNADCIWKFAAVSEDRAALDEFMRAIDERLGLTCDRSGHFLLDITHAGNSKGNRLGEWIADLGIFADEVLAIGDQHNDLSMLRLAGLGVAMGNGEEAVRACAGWVTGSNDDGGVVEALRRFVLTPGAHPDKMRVS